MERVALHGLLGGGTVTGTWELSMDHTAAAVTESSPSSLRRVFDFEMSLIPSCRDITRRGLRVDNKLRLERIAALQGRQDELLAKVQDLAQDQWDGLKRPDLFLLEKRCGCCGGGTLQRFKCLKCSGYAGKTIKDIAAEKGYTQKAIREEFLFTCETCSGAGKLFSTEFNPDSSPQVADLLYEALGLPARYSDKKLTTDEEALQSLVALDSTGVVLDILRYRKVATMREIYERLEPDPADSKVRTVINPIGTYTNRPSSSGAFYVPYSTNLLNITEAEGARDPLYVARDVIVPDPGEVLMYGDLAAAEARVVAALSEDEFMLEQWARDPYWSPHRWTASKIFGVPEEQIDKKSPLYFLGKQSRHAFNYGEGPNKFWRVINSMADVTGVAITLTQARACFGGYHKLHPNLDQVWWERVQEKVQRDGYLVNCFGFKCNFFPRFNPENRELDPETLRAAIAWEPQSTIGMLAKYAWGELASKEKGRGYRVLLETYDGVMVGVDKFRVGAMAKLLKAALERTIVVNGRELRIPAEIFLCRERWSESERVL